MGDRYPKLRERLRQVDPDLAADLDLQWRIAESEWLPAIPPNLDSSNGRPHLRNIEDHLDETFATLHQHKPSASVLEMRPIELYLLLAAVLFHDIGRGQAGPDDDHGQITGRMLVKDHNTYGIHNGEIAHSLAAICRSHTLGSKGWPEGDPEFRLGDVVIDPYGQVRERMIAALLTLGDYMDCARSRAVPDYLREDKDVIGAFRTIIRGVIADPAARLIRTTLAPVEAEAGTPVPFSPNSTDGDKWLGKLAAAIRVPPADLSLPENLPSGEDDPKGAACALEKGFEANREQLQKLFGKLEGQQPPSLVERLISWKVLYARPQKGTTGADKWLKKSLIAVVMGNLRENRASLYSIREHLAAVGLPLATWLVERDERLYTPNYCETFEPVLNLDYLGEVAWTMWELSARIFGVSEFTYGELAAQLGDQNVARVRLAARRIAIVTTGCKPETSDGFAWSGPIWVGDETWKWRVSRRSMAGADFVSFKQVKDRLGELCEPDDPTERSGVQ
jgi:hypothetical protein